MPDEAGRPRATVGQVALNDGAELNQTGERAVVGAARHDPAVWKEGVKGHGALPHATGAHRDRLIGGEVGGQRFAADPEIAAAVSGLGARAIEGAAVGEGTLRGHARAVGRDADCERSPDGSRLGKRRSRGGKREQGRQPGENPAHVMLLGWICPTDRKGRTVSFVDQPPRGRHLVPAATTIWRPSAYFTLRTSRHTQPATQRFGPTVTCPSRAPTYQCVVRPVWKER